MQIIGRALPLLQNAVSSGLDSVTQGLVQNAGVAGSPALAQIRDSFSAVALNLSPDLNPASSVAPEAGFPGPVSLNDQSLRPELMIGNFAGSLRDLTTQISSFANSPGAEQGIIIIGGRFQPVPPPIMPDGPPIEPQSLLTPSPPPIRTAMPQPPPIRVASPDGPPIEPQSVQAPNPPPIRNMVPEPPPIRTLLPNPPPIVPDGPPIEPQSLLTPNPPPIRAAGPQPPPIRVAGPDGPPIMPQDVLSPTPPPIFPQLSNADQYTALAIGGIFGPNPPPIRTGGDQLQPSPPPIREFGEGPSPPPILPADVFQSQLQALREMEVTVLQSTDLYRQLNSSLLAGRVLR